VKGAPFSTKNIMKGVPFCQNSILGVELPHMKGFFRVPTQTFQPPSRANLEVLKNKPRKTWSLGPQTWRLQKYASNKIDNDRSFVSEYSLPY